MMSSVHVKFKALIELNVPPSLGIAGYCQHALGSCPIDLPEQTADYVV